MACNIKPGDTSENVKQLQLFLKVKGHYKGKIDKIYGTYTKKAVKTYQRKNKLYPDGWAGCKTTHHMQLKCKNHNCDKKITPKTQPSTKSDNTHPQPIKPIPSIPLNPNQILPDHTVSIGNIGFYAETPELVEPFQRTNYEKIEIENGPPRFYPTNTINRELNFKVTLLKQLPSQPYTNTDGKPNFQELLNNIKKCQGIQQFSSIYIGSFQALVTIKINDFNPGTATATFNIQEIP